MNANRLDKSCTVRRYDTLNGSADFYDVSSRTSVSFDTANDISRLTWVHVRARLEERFVRAAEVKAEDIEGGKSGARMVVRALRRTAGFADAKEVLECSVWLAALLAAVLNAALDISDPTPTPHDFFATRDSRTATPTPTPAPEPGPSGENKKPFFAAVPPTPQSVPAKRRASQAFDLDFEPVPLPLGGRGKGKARAIELDDEDDDIVFVSDLGRRSRSCAPEVQPRVKRELEVDENEEDRATSAGSPELEEAEGGGEQEEAAKERADGFEDPFDGVPVLGKCARPPPGYLAGLDRSITPPAGRAEAFDDQEYLPEENGKAAKSPEKTGKRAKKGELMVGSPIVAGLDGRRIVELSVRLQGAAGGVFAPPDTGRLVRCSD
ncbi:hypothetical protein JCM10296v2_006833 [Rhodotorula toruloides]